jgi:hypothetical protein
MLLSDERLGVFIGMVANKSNQMRSAQEGEKAVNSSYRRPTTLPASQIPTRKGWLKFQKS